MLKIIFWSKSLFDIIVIVSLDGWFISLFLKFVLLRKKVAILALATRPEAQVAACWYFRGIVRIIGDLLVYLVHVVNKFMTLTTWHVQRERYIMKCDASSHCHTTKRMHRTWKQCITDALKNSGIVMFEACNVRREQNLKKGPSAQTSA